MCCKWLTNSIKSIRLSNICRFRWNYSPNWKKEWKKKNKENQIKRKKGKARFWIYFEKSFVTVVAYPLISEWNSTSSNIFTFKSAWLCLILKYSLRLLRWFFMSSANVIVIQQKPQRKHKMHAQLWPMIINPMNWPRNAAE